MNDQKSFAGTGWGMSNFVRLASIQVATLAVRDRESVDRAFADFGSGHGRSDSRGYVVEEDAVIQDTLAVIDKLVTHPGKG